MTYRYGVAIIGDESKIDHCYANRRTGSIVGFERVPTEMGIADNGTGNRLYWAETLRAAQDMADRITQSYPTYRAIVFESKEMYTRPPGTLSKAVWSDKGLLPE